VEAVLTIVHAASFIEIDDSDVAKKIKKISAPGGKMTK
jgi:hypothetical protein